jgi:exodeoxyribonuclease V alpha subunit
MSEELPLLAGAETPPASAPVEHGVSGEVVGVPFCSDDGAYAVVRIVDSDCAEHVLVGPLGGLAEGQHLEANGRWEQHKTYGSQFRVTSYKPVLPRTTDGMARYLGSGVLPGIGAKFAKRIVDKFGSDTFRVLDHYSGRLSEVPGLGKGRLAKIKKAWAEQSGQRELYSYLQGLGVTPAYCNRIIRHYGEGAADAVATNPYKLANEIRGIGFKMADGIARNLNIEKENPFRLAAGVSYCITQMAQQGGHCCCPMSLLIERASSMLEVDEAAVRIGVEKAALDGAVVVSKEGCREGDNFVYPAQLHAAEVELAEMLQAFAPAPDLDALHVELGQGDSWRMLNAEQKHAVEAAFRYPLSIITGGPGVGKTTVTREIVALAKKQDWKVALAAPTGRAAKRLSESARRHAGTIHRLLKWEPEHGGFAFNRGNPLTADLLIVDEVSMLDLVLAVSLFRAVAPPTRVVLVGDRDQLPSVGPGSVLRDLICCERFPVTELKHVYRQGKGSRIIVNAHRVNEGKMPVTARGDQLQDFYWIEQEEPDKVLDVMSRLISDRIPTRFGLSAHRDVHVLSPMNRGDCGVNRINHFLQDLLNPHQDDKPECKQGETSFRVGDRVMQRVNNYDLAVFNGDLGYICEIRKDAKQLSVTYDSGDAIYGFDDLDQLSLAYATTIHKSQGSEFPAVIVPVLTQHYVMLRRNLIYTAMTRAKRLLVLIGSAKAMRMAVENFRVTPRYSYLAHRLQLAPKTSIPPGYREH